MSAARKERDVDIDADVNIDPGDAGSADPERKSREPHPYFTWHKEQYTERIRRRLRSDRTSLGLSAGTSLLVLLLLVQPFWRIGRHTRTWIGSNQVAYTLTVKNIELPPLNRASSEAKAAFQPLQWESDRGNASSSIDDLSRLHYETREEPPERRSGGAARFRDGSRDGLDPGLLQAAARPHQRLQPRPVRPDTTAPLLATAEMLVPAPDLTDAEALDRPPQLDAKSLHIDYPAEAKRQHIEGSVILHFYVDTEGRTSSIHVLKSLHPACDGAAVTALFTARFTPGEEHGRPVGTFTRLIVRFVLR